MDYDLIDDDFGGARHGQRADRNALADDQGLPVPPAYRTMTPTPLLACLCAAWCRLCDEYAPVVASVAAAFNADGASLQVHWIDIEDDADLVGDVDVETFPTIVIATGTRVHFAGPVTPHPDTLRRLLRATMQDAPSGAPAPIVSKEIQALVARLHQLATDERP